MVTIHFPASQTGALSYILAGATPSRRSHPEAHARHVWIATRNLGESTCGD